MSDGSVFRGIVIEILESHGAEVSQIAGSDKMFSVVKGDVFEVVAIPEVCGRKVVRYLSRKFSAPIHHFYNPLMAPAKPDEPIQ